MQSKNPYESIKADALLGEEPTKATEGYSKNISESREETITIHTARLAQGYWIYGYTVYWANGRTSCRAPDPELGLFATRRDAELYAVGFMKQYANYFTAESRAALDRAEKTLSQATIF